MQLASGAVVQGNWFRGTHQRSHGRTQRSESQGHWIRGARQRAASHLVLWSKDIGSEGGRQCSHGRTQHSESQGHGSQVTSAMI